MKSEENNTEEITEYRMCTWKLSVEGEYTSEEEAIKSLADRYMKISKCSPPGEHPVDMLNNSPTPTMSVGKGVCFYVHIELFGIKQWIQKYAMNIYPFKAEHWWDSNKGFTPPVQEFQYEILNK